MVKVYLAVGHGKRDDGTFDPGAVAKDGGWNEQTAGDVIVAEAAGFLEDAGATVFSEARSDDPNYRGTTRQANGWGADFVVEVHHDWNGAPEGAFGHWVSDAGKALADAVQQSVGGAGFPLRNDWHKRRTDLYILKQTVAPCVLYEVGRIGTGDLDTEAELRAMGRALAAGVAQHLGLEPAAPASEPGPEPESEPEPEPAPAKPERRRRTSKSNWTEDVVDTLPTIEKGVQGRRPAVRRAQGLLAAAGLAPTSSFPSGRPDGIFGRYTRNAVVRFQREAGIGVDGIVGPNTWTALLGG